ncbi:arsenite methyltransferase [Spirosoma luteum]|uniref:arsenite methyltransferase n=1 Tax=Spirosoma luteum TaxID=431553 RepID=UPI0003707D62|nr:arsenite methyltransferase [Spirosoma luteum]
MTTDQQASDNALKNVVQEAYGTIATQTREYNAASCCGAGPSVAGHGIMADDYTQLAGYVADADLGLGCGLPTQFARIKPGDTVIDLGSGAGNDCFVARQETGPAGKVIGIDFTDAMISRARQNADALGFNNVEFRSGDIEQMPVSSQMADVVVSNCVLNLVPNKAAVFAEIFRVLKAGGHFSISDIVLVGELPDNLRQAANMYAGCVSGAIQKADYLQLIETAGFTNMTLQKEKTIFLPDELLMAYLTTDEIAAFRASGTGIVSITAYAEKPVVTGTVRIPVQLIDVMPASGSVCQPGGGCC